jgi:excisionase family DNA binding protein
LSQPEAHTVLALYEALLPVVRAIVHETLAALPENALYATPRVETTPAWLTVPQAATYAGVARDTIRRALTAGTLPYGVVSNTDKGRRIHRDDLDTWIRTRMADKESNHDSRTTTGMVD